MGGTMKVAFWIVVFGLAVPAYAYVGYPALLFVLASFVQTGRDAFYLLFRNDRRRRGNRRHRVSLILAAHNEEEVIERTLERCLSTEYPRDRLEILLGSDASSDRTVEIARKFEADGVRVLAFPERRGKLAVVRDCAREARGEILAFSDANTLLRPDAVGNLVRHFSDPTIGAVCGELRLVGPEGRPVDEGLYWRYEQTLKLLESRLDSVLGANGAIYAIRKDLFPQLPLNLITDDFVIPMSARSRGFRVCYDPESVAEEDAPIAVSDEFRRRVRIGSGNWQALRQCADLLLPWKGFISLAFWSHKVLRWFGPFLLAAALAANLLLLSEPMGRRVFGLQLAFYGCAALGDALRRLKLPSGPFRLAHYFVVINAALALGMIKGLFGVQQAAWKRTAREPTGARGMK